MNGFIRPASYLRVSSQRQADEKTIDSQQVDVCARATRDGVSIDSAFEYIDDGYSGAELLRPALERLRDHVAAAMRDPFQHRPDEVRTQRTPRQPEPSALHATVEKRCTQPLECGYEHDAIRTLHLSRHFVEPFRTREQAQIH